MPSSFPRRTPPLRPTQVLRRGGRRAATTLTAATVLLVVAAAPAAAVSVNPSAPPGTGDLQSILNWGGWLVSFICAAGVLAVAAMMAITHRRGEGGEHVGKLGLVLGAAVLGTAAGPLITALT